MYSFVPEKQKVLLRHSTDFKPQRTAVNSHAFHLLWNIIRKPWVVITAKPRRAPVTPTTASRANYNYANSKNFCLLHFFLQNLACLTVTVCAEQIFVWCICVSISGVHVSCNTVVKTKPRYNSKGLRKNPDAVLVHALSLSDIQSVSHSLNHNSLTHLIRHSLTQSPTCPVNHSLIHSLTHIHARTDTHTHTHSFS